MRDERWLTVAQVADVVQVHPETVREWLRTGKLRGTLLSRRAGWRVREGDVQRLLAGDWGDVGEKHARPGSVPRRLGREMEALGTVESTSRDETW